MVFATHSTAHFYAYNKYTKNNNGPAIYRAISHILTNVSYNCSA